MIDFDLSSSLTLEQARVYVGVSRRTIYVMAEKGQLPGAYRLGWCWRVDKKILSDHVEKGVQLPGELQGVANCEPGSMETGVSGEAARP